MEARTPDLPEILNASGLSQVQFMTNAVDTRTRGLDFVANYLIPIREGSITLTAAGNFTETNIPRDADGNPVIKTGEFLAGFGTVLFNREEVSRIEVAQPRSKIIMGVNPEVQGIGIGHQCHSFWRNPIHSPQRSPRENLWNNGEMESLDQTFSPKILTDVDLSYTIYEGVRLGIGGANIFNIYPDRHTHSANYGGGMFPYSRRVSQFGLAGAGFMGS